MQKMHDPVIEGNNKVTGDTIVIPIVEHKDDEIQSRYRGGLEDIQETAVRGSGIGSGDTTWVGPPTSLGNLALVKGVVSDCGRP